MLPKLNDTPLFTMKVPSSGMEVKYRPYLVKEEKVLLMAFESGDNKQALSAVADTILSCVEGDLNKSSLTPYDVEYMFTQIRGKSVGEVAKVSVNCTECGTQNEVSIDLEKVYVDSPENNKNIKISDRYMLELKQPTYMDMVKVVPSNDDISAMFDTLNTCLYSVHDLEEETQTLFSDESKEETDQFIESLPPKVLNDIKNFMESMPKTKYKIVFKCTKCDHETDTELEGMQNFL